MCDYLPHELVRYKSGALIRCRCSKCGRMVKAPKRIKMDDEHIIEAKGRCSKCGKIDLECVGWDE